MLLNHCSSTCCGSRYLIWQVRQIKLPLLALSTPLILTMIPLDGAEPISLCGSWHEEHCILCPTSNASSMLLPVRLVPSQVGGTGGVFTVSNVLGSPI